jgi:ATP-binding cassette subfamily B protein
MKESGSVLKWVWDELVGAEGKKLLVRMFMVMVGSTLLLALQPLVFSSIINYVHDTHAKFLIAAVAALAATALLQHGVSFVQQIVREKAWNRTMFSMQTRLNELFYEKTLGQHLEEGSSLSYTTIDRAKGRIETIQQMLLFDTGGMVIQIFFSYLLLWVLSWKIGLVATILVCAHIAWSLYLNYHVSVETESIEQGFRAHGRQLIERWEKIARVKTSGKSASEHARLARWFDDVLGQDFRFWSWFIKQAMIRDGMILIARVVIVAYGAYLVYRGVWQVGTLIPLYAWITDLSLNLGWIGHAERRVNQQVPYIKALRNALEIVPAFSEEEGVAMKNVEPIKVEFCGIHLAYQEPGMPAYPILRDVSFVVRPGEKVALIGPSGAGKTSIMKLLLRFLDPSAGEIWVNGSRLADVRLASWMEHVGYIPQEAQVFDGTIRYNLTFGLSAERQALITDEEIWEVMRLLQIDFGGRLIHGLDTVVGKDGMKLSGGQKQRLMIGAAVIKKPIFMVIDEATASLDSSTERLVQEGLEKVLAGPTGALIVAHRLSTVRTICNRFIVLRPLEEVTEGLTQVEAEAGSFEELYVISPTFQRLANDQHIRL